MSDTDLEESPLTPCPASVPDYPDLSCDWPEGHDGPHRIVIEWDDEEDAQP